MKLLIVATLLLSGCGGAYTVAVNPVNVNVKYSFSTDDLERAFIAECQADMPGASDTDIQNCADLTLAKLLSNLIGG